MPKVSEYIHLSQYCILAFLCPLAIFFHSFADTAMTYIAISSMVILLMDRDKFDFLKQRILRPIILFLALFCISGLISSALSNYPGTSLYNIVKTIVLLSGVFIFALYLAQKNSILTYRTLLLSATVSLIVLFFEIFSENLLLTLMSPYIKNVYIDNKYYSLAAIILVLLTWLLIVLSPKSKKGFCVALFLLSCVACAFLNTYAIFLALPVAAFATILVLITPRLGPLSLAAATVVGLISAPLVWTSIDYYSDSIAAKASKSRLSFAHRYFIYKHTAEKSMDKPFAGYGLGSYRQEHYQNRVGDERTLELLVKSYSQPLTPDEIEEVVAVSYPHNIFLQVWYDLGLLGVCLFSLLSVYMLYQVSNMDRPRLYKAIFCGAYCYLIVINFSSYNIWKTWWLGFGALALGLLYINLLNREGSEENEVNPKEQTR